MLLAVDGYRYGDREVDRSDEIESIREQLPGLGATVVLPYLRDEAPERPGMLSWADLGAQGAALPEAVGQAGD